jgi:hypothetical protein
VTQERKTMNPQPTDCLATIQAALALRDAVRSAREWADVPAALEVRGLSLDEARRRLRPRIEFDPHTHTIYSDGILDYRQLLWWCKAVGLRAVGVTDHDNIDARIGDAVEEGEGLGIRFVPGLEFTVHRLGGRSWEGLEIGAHFFPPARFADFIRSAEGTRFCERFAVLNRLKSEQGWGALERVNAGFMVPRGLKPIARDELWQASGCVDPVCVGTLTVVMLERFFGEGHRDLLAEFPNTRAIMTYLGKSGFSPPIQSPPQTLDDLARIRAALTDHGIRSTLTLNHPEEWLTKCGLTLTDGSPDLPGIRRLVALMLLHEPNRTPFSFIELYSSRNTESSRRLFASLYEEFREARARFFPSLPQLHPIASTDSHRVSGCFDADGRVQGWVPGEDFVLGIGMVDEAHPAGNLDVPADYPGADDLLALMDQCAT